MDSACGKPQQIAGRHRAGRCSPRSRARSSAPPSACEKRLVQLHLERRHAALLHGDRHLDPAAAPRAAGPAPEAATPIAASDGGMRSCRSRNRWFTARRSPNRRGLVVAVSEAKPVMLLIMTTDGSLVRRPARARRSRCLEHLQRIQLRVHAARVAPAARRARPISTTRPRSSTMIASARRTVDSRCAMTNDVRLRISVRAARPAPAARTRRRATRSLRRGSGSANSSAAPARSRAAAAARPTASGRARRCASGSPPAARR